MNRSGVVQPAADLVLIGPATPISFRGCAYGKEAVPMPVDDIEHDDDLEPEDDEPLARRLRQQIKDANKATKAAEERAAAGETALRRVAFMDAGIPDTPQARFFREKYDGALDADAIKAQATEYGIISDQSAETDAEIRGIEAQSAAGTGGDQPIVTGSQADMLREMDEAAAASPRGRESQAIAAVMQKYGMSVGDS